MNIEFNNYQCKLVFGHYHNYRTAIMLNDAVTGERVAVATVNLPDVELAPQQVIIKNYSENEGMLDVLVHDGVISHPVRFVDQGFVTFPVCDLLKRE